MPIIPMPKAEGLAALPGPVLNRERGPTVNLSGVRSAVGAVADAARMPDAPMSLAENGLGAIGEAIARTGSVMGALAAKREEALSRIQLGEADTAINDVMTGFKTYTETNPQVSPAAWAPELQKRLGEAQSQFLSRKDISPQAAEEIQRHFQLRSKSLLIGAQSASDKALFQKAKNTEVNEIKLGTVAQDPTRYQTARSNLLKNGWAAPYEIEAMDMEYAEEGKRQKLQAKADNFSAAQDSVTAAVVAAGYTAGSDLIESMDLDPMEKEQLRGLARRTGQGQRADALGMLEQGIFDGSLDSVAAIEELANRNPHFSPEVLNAAKAKLFEQWEFKAEVSRQQNLEEDYKEAYQLVEAYDSATDKDGVKGFELMRTLREKVGNSDDGYLRQKLYGKLSGQKFVPPPTEIKGFIDQTLDSIFEPRSGASPWEVQVPIYKTDEKGQPTKAQARTVDGGYKFEWKADEAKKQKALEIRAQVYSRWLDWARRNPEKAKNPREAREELNRLLPDGLMGAALRNAQTKLEAQAKPVTRETPLDFPLPESGPGAENNLFP